MTRDYRSLLLEEYAARQARNPLYSKRAFARDLGVPASTLSEHMNHSTELGAKNTAKVREFLKRIGRLTEDEGEGKLAPPLSPSLPIPGVG